MGYPVLQKDTLASALQGSVSSHIQSCIVIRRWCSFSEIKSNQRTKLVYRCQVLGGKGCGKSSFVRGLLGKGQMAIPADVEVEAVSIKAITLPNSASYVYLVVSTGDLQVVPYCPTLQLQENAFGEEEDESDVTPVVAAALDQCDVACLLYDSSDRHSFSIAAAMLVSSFLDVHSEIWCSD